MSLREAGIAANRYGLGARPGELPLLAGDPRGWLKAQLGLPRGQTDTYPLPTTQAVLPPLQDLFREQMAGQRRVGSNGKDDPASHLRSSLRAHYLEHTTTHLVGQIQSEQPFRERLVDFWANHFAVSADKPPLPAIAPLFVNEAIRPALNGSFTKLLLAVESHPAMILYLDNQRSIGPNSSLARRAARSRRKLDLGLNENLAREILELHTLGVQGGYGQADVQALANVITGWSLGGALANGRLDEGIPGTFEFRAALHEPGPQVVLGKRYAQDGPAQGEAVLADLSRHPATIRRISEKLARHFVADDPPDRTVDRLAEAWEDSDGHLPTVHATLVDLPEAWENVQAKVRTPIELVVSGYRALGQAPRKARHLIGSLETLGQVPFRPGSPEGWPDVADAWTGADAVLKRVEWAVAMARLEGSRQDPEALAEAVLGPALGDHTRTALSRAGSAEQGLALLLASPEFQRR
jgi:uncharacterized protein (DUF1800 family)